MSVFGLHCSHEQIPPSALIAAVQRAEEAGDGLVTEIVDDARAITPGLEHINRTGGVVAHALPYLYGFAEEIVAKVTPRPVREGAVGRRRSRIHETVGYRP